ncbi:hypothetical protein HPT29_026025 (plasmid) [Microvirga terrae]|uniref:Transposase n=1 Tax=Microvirga terrae TaxID=2740529 RepID=A0ABY5S0T1_9HYPH|nr:hypothetical protein [Microvirga terrae]UVF22159.1 hypothetical protein HPT29_026025 [Microvirga terrae]
MFKTFAALGETAHLVQMVDSTIVRAHVSSLGGEGAEQAGPGPLAWGLLT